MLTMWTLAACLIASTPVPDLAPRDDVWEAPSLPAWPEGLSGWRRTPGQAKCFAGGLELGRGIWLPHPYNVALTERLKACEGLPGLMQRQLERIQGKILPDFVNAAVNESLAWDRAQRIAEQESAGFLSDLALTVAIVVGVLGFAGGLAIGIVAAQ